MILLRFSQFVNIVLFLFAGFIGGIDLWPGVFKIVHSCLAGETLNCFPGNGLLFRLFFCRFIKDGAAAAEAGDKQNKDTLFHVYEDTLNPGKLQS